MTYIEISSEPQHVRLRRPERQPEDGERDWMAYHLGGYVLEGGEYAESWTAVQE